MRACVCGCGPQAATWLRPGGSLVYAVCSLEPQEGEQLITRFLAKHPEFERRAVVATELAGRDDWITSAGDLRTLPCHWPNEDPRMSGLDGFYAARLERHRDFDG